MSRLLLNRTSEIAPFMMSLAAFLLVLVAVATGWDMCSNRVQIPFILALLITADWKRFLRVAGIISLQAAAVALAFAPVHFYKL